MDHRLREVPDVQDIVSGILEVLDDRIQNCAAVLKTLDNSHPEKLELAEVPETENFDRSIRAIANEISLLHRLSNTIRRASKHSQNTKATRTFQIKDDEGNNAEQSLEKLFAFYIRDIFPEISEVIRQRLASTMLLRRKRILYRRSRYSQAPIKPRKTISQPTVALPLIQQQTATTLEQPQRSDNPKVATTSAQSMAQSLAVTTTTLAPDSFKKASAPSVISESKTVALSNHQDLIFPPAPNGRIKEKYKPLKKQREEGHVAHIDSLRRLLGVKIKEQSAELLSEFHQRIADAEAKLQKTLDKDWHDCVKAIAEVTCPFCFYALPSQDIVDEKKWRAHVKNDLDAYVCLFEECDTPEELYNHSDEWLKHMRDHALRWRCISKSHGERVFITRDDYVSHMSEVHRGAFTDAQLSVLAERNARTIGPLFEFCPLCGVKDAKGPMEDHIVGHLRFVALKSLPPYQDEGSEGSRSERSLGSSKPPSRSTIKKDPERHLELAFDDDDQQPRTQQRHKGSYTTQSPYAEWGGYWDYISKFPQGLSSYSAHFPLPFIPDDEAPNSLTPLTDPSTDSVEESLFVGVPRSDWRRFEWEFATEAHGSTQSLDNDSIIQTLLKYSHEKLSRENIQPALFDGEEFSSTRNAMDPLLSLPAEKPEMEIKSTRNEAEWQEISHSDAASMNNMPIDPVEDSSNEKEEISSLLDRREADDHIREELSREDILVRTSGQQKQVGSQLETATSKQEFGDPATQVDAAQGSHSPYAASQGTSGQTFGVTNKSTSPSAGLTAQSSTPNDFLEPVGISSLTQVLADSSINPTSQESHQDSYEPRQPEEQSRTDERSSAHHASSPQLSRKAAGTSSRRNKKGRDEYYPTRWSDWEWNEQYQRYARYRELAKGKWEWEYDEPQASEPHTEAFGQGVHPALWTPRDSSIDPHGALPRIDEQSMQYDEPAPGQNYRLDFGSVSNITQGLTDASLNPSYQESHQYDDQPRQSEDRSRADDKYGRDEKRKGKSSSYSDDRQGRDRKGKNRKGEPSYDKHSYTSEDHAAADQYAGESNQDHQDYGGSQPETASKPEFEYLALQGDTAPPFHSPYPAAQGTSGQSYSAYSQPSGQTAGYTAPGYGVATSPSYGASSSIYTAPPRAQDNTPRFIRTKHPRDKVDQLDSRFKVHRSSEFKFGKVFKVLWSEPIGSGGTEITVNARLGEKAFHKIRRFLVVNNLKGHSICIPILTYGYQGVLKHGVHPHDHAVIYSSRRDGPYLLDREEGLMSKKAIRVEIKDPSHKLDPMSRLNYAKIYTVEHNVKVLFIGEVAKNYEQAVVVAFNDTHPPSSSRPYSEIPDSPDVYTMGFLGEDTQKADPSYPNIMPIPDMEASSAYDSSSTQAYPSGYSNPAYGGSSYTAPTPYSGPASQPYGLSYSAEPSMPSSGYPPTSQAGYDQATPNYEDAYDP